MIRYYCSGFDVGNAFGHGLGETFKIELKGTKNIVYIPGSPDKMEKARTKYIPAFVEYFKKVGMLLQVLLPNFQFSFDFFQAMLFFFLLYKQHP